MSETYKVAEYEDMVQAKADILEVKGTGWTDENLVDLQNTKVNLTKMPDGANAVYSQDAWATVDGWEAPASVLSLPTSGIIRATMVGTGAGGLYRSIPSTAGKTVIFRYRLIDSQPWIFFSASSGGVQLYSVQPSTEWSVIKVQSGVPFTSPYFRRNSGTDGGYMEIDWIWIGDYSYLDNSLATEASRIANQLGDTAGVGTAANGTITSNGTNVSDGDTVTIAGKVYTFKTALTPTEGEVKIGSDAGASISRLYWAINRASPETHDGVNYKIAEAHPLVIATTVNPYLILTLTAKSVGILGNSITLAKSATTLTLSGSTLTGGTDDVGEKLRTQIASLNGQWITPTLLNSWVAYDADRTARYVKDAQGNIRLRGGIKSGTIGTVMFTLPTGYRPPESQNFPCMSNNAFGYITISSSGNIVCWVGNNASVYLDGITFKAEA